MSLPLILLFTIRYTSGDPSSCSSLLPTGKMRGAHDSLFPDSAQLDALCPGFLDFSRCFRSASQDTPEDFDEDTLANYRSLVASFGELCSEGSQMRENYLTNVECLKSVEREWKSCLHKSTDIYERYRAENENDPIPDEEFCFKRGYAVGCMSQKIQDVCGPAATAVYQLFMTKYRFVTDECSTEAAAGLQTRFLEYLKLSELQKPIFKGVFNVTG